MKKYYTTDKNGEEVEVDKELAKQLVASGKRKPEDFTIEGEDDKEPESKQSPVANDLYTKGLQVGYSGLSKDEQAQLDYQYAKSEASKTMSIEEVRAKMDANAAISRKMAEENKPASGFSGFVTDVIPEMPRAGYQAAKDMMAGIVGPYVGGIETLYKHYLEPQAKDVNGKAVVEDNDLETNINKAIETGSKGEGFTGFISEPTNLIPGLPVARFGKGVPGVIGRALAEGGKNAAVTGFEDVMNDQTENIGRDMVLSGIIGSVLGGVGSSSKAKQNEQIEKALATFPGDKYFRTQANKGAELYEPMSDATKIEILKGIPGEGSKEDWIRYYEDVSRKAQDGYSAVDKIAETYKDIPNSEISISKLKQDMIDKMNAGVGSYSKKDAEKFVNSRLEGFFDKYGKDGKVPVHKLGEIKGKFTEDIFDPKFTVSEGTKTKRTLAGKAGSTIEEIREKQKAYFPKGVEVDPRVGEYFKDRETGDILGKFIESQGLSYNDLLKLHSPETVEMYKRAKNLESIFLHQPEFTGSQRTGSGILGKIFEGAKHEYKPSGDAYKDPIKLLKKGESKTPENIQKGVSLVSLGIGRLLGDVLGR